MTLPKIGKRAFLLVLAAAAGCSKPTVAVITPELAARSTVPSPDAQVCAKCHPNEVEAWKTSQHANANRLISRSRDAAALANRKQLTGRPEAAIGVTPLVQYLLPFPGGRLQVQELSYDPRSNDWFNVYGDENRQPHEWGYWANRGMNWNSQCAFCHMTGFRKNYDPESDAYSSTWVAMGISCAQCHVVRDQSSAISNQCPMTDHGSRITGSAAMDNCASCHARREYMTDDFKPGDPFNDHFRLALPDLHDLYFADGQVLAEDYEYGSFLMSRMGHKGIVCMDCHNPHTGKLIYIAANNTLCLTCHSPPVQRGSIAINATAHSHHKPDSTGNRCIECHMPQTVYMQRDARRDHGFTSPDPLLTKELGIPNACNRCHADQSTDWAIKWTDNWYGTNMNRRARDRARVVSRAWAGDDSVVTSLVAMAGSEEIVAWRAALTGMLSPWNTLPNVRSFIESSLTHSNALVRSAAVRALAGASDSYEALVPLRRDTSSLVRVDAALLTANQVERDAVAAADVATYLRTIGDQPVGALHNAEAALNEGHPAEAESWGRKVVEWDPTAVSHHAFGLILHRAGKSAEALKEFAESARLDTGDATYSYDLALLQAELGRINDAVNSLEDTVRRDPSFGRAWYNLGLARAQLNQLAEAVAALQMAERLMPESPDAPYALSTIHARMNDVERARAAAERAQRLR